MVVIVIAWPMTIFFDRDPFVATHVLWTKAKDIDCQ